MKRYLHLLLALSLPASALADWPQWRGANRNGIATEGSPLSKTWPTEGPKKVWESEAEIPSNDDGGHGSPVVADGKVYLSVVWHTDVPTDSRRIDELVLRKLGHRKLNLPEALVEKMEAARVGRNPRLRGDKLDQWIGSWIAENLDEDQTTRLDGWIKGRFKKGKSAIPIKDLEVIGAQRDRVFAGQAELEEWVAAQGFSERVATAVLAAVPATKKVANDVILCIDAASGKTIFKSELPGEPTGRKSSSTPCVSGGKVYAVGSTRVFCVDAKTGEKVWETPIAAKGVASSVLVEDGIVIALCGKLSAYDARTGAELWQNKEFGGQSSSPAIWRHAAGALILCNGQKTFGGIDLKTGETRWSFAGGGDSTPAVSGDHCAVYSKHKDAGLSVYTLDPASPTKLWSLPLKTRRYCSSPIIYQDKVYLLGGSQHLCADLEGGEPHWNEKRNSEISSPLLADGKLFVLDTNGSFLSMLRASPAGYEELARAKLRAMRCPSPAFSAGHLYLRTDDRIACFDLR